LPPFSPEPPFATYYVIEVGGDIAPLTFNRKLTAVVESVRLLENGDERLSVDGAEVFVVGASRLPLFLFVDGDDSITGSLKDDIISGVTGNDVLAGRFGNDILNGGLGQDTLDGGAGIDRLFGDAGNDRLAGGSGTDHLSGGSGNDTLTGGSEQDRLIGGSGRDTFNFNAISESRPAKRDSIADFRRNYDKIDLRGIDADQDHTAGNQDFVFIGSRSFTGRDGELRFSKGLVQGDVNGDKIADFAIKVDAAKFLTASDFDL
jgi:Ca2+-binding RTX toxin-like protein